jgi:hypothetical protein
VRGGSESTGLIGERAIDLLTIHVVGSEKWVTLTCSKEIIHFHPANERRVDSASSIDFSGYPHPNMVEKNHF